MRNEYASMEIDHFFAFFFFQLGCFLAGHFLSIFFNNRLFTCLCLLLVLRVHKVGVMVKQVLNQFLHDFVICLEIIKTNRFLVCNNCVLLTFYMSHSFSSAIEKETKSVILEWDVLGTWVIYPRAKTKKHQHEGYPQGELS